MTAARCAFILWCAAAVAAQEPTPRRFVAGIHPTDSGRVEENNETWLACRVVDAVTGRPIARAELFLVAEANTPLPGQFTYLRKVTSDERGFAALPLGEYRPEWLVLRAEGYGPTGSSGSVPGLVWPLARGLDVPIALRDWLDRPVPGAGVGLCLGCGHTPDVVHATADEQGVAVLRCIDPHAAGDLYPEHPGLGIEDADGLDWAPGDPPNIVRASYSESLLGRVLGPDGAVVAGAFVGARQKHRGPWTVTRADGSFQLDGAAPRFDPIVVLPDRPDQECVFASPWQQPAVLRLPAPSDERYQVINHPQPPKGPVGSVVLHLVDVGGQPLPEMAVSLVGPLPARHVWTAPLDAKPRLEVAAGTYEVHGHDRRFPELLGMVSVAASATIEHVLQPRPLPAVRLDVPPGCKVHLVHCSRSVDVTDVVARGVAVPVPEGEPFAFVLRSKDDERILPFTAEQARQHDPLPLRFLPPTRVRARLVDEQGQPVAATATLLPRGAFLRNAGSFDVRTFAGVSVRDGVVELTSKEAGMHVLAVRPARTDLRPRCVAVSLPHRGENARVDLGDLRLGSAPPLRIVTAGGTPYAGAPAGLVRLGWFDVRDTPPAFPHDTGGGWLGLDPAAGDAIVVPADAWDLEPDPDGPAIVTIPHRAVLAGPGPWTVTVPEGEVVVDVRDREGELLAATAFVADRSVMFSGRATLRQLPPGSTELAVVAAGHLTEVATVDVPARGRIEVRFALPRR